MKLLGLCASPNKQKSQTSRIVNAVLEGCKTNGADIEFIDLCNLKINFCNGCRSCFITGNCIYKDDYQLLLEKMLIADGLVWGSPNYSFCVTARMKALIDRMASVIHCQNFDGKYCVAVATGGRDDKVITEYIKTIFLDFGAYVTGTVGAVVSRGAQEIDSATLQAFELGKALSFDIKTKHEYQDQRLFINDNRRDFQRKIRESNGLWKYEIEYWNKNNWR